MFTENQLTRRRLLSALSLLPAARLLSGQQSQPAGQMPKYSAEVKVVNLFATVRDKSGKIVKDLIKDDFTLDDEDHPQTIKFFEQESGLALSLGLLVDTSGSQARVLDKERSASFRISTPSFCDLEDSPEEQILRGYLPVWGIQKNANSVATTA